MENDNVLDMDGVMGTQHAVTVLNVTQLYTWPQSVPKFMFYVYVSIINERTMKSGGLSDKQTPQIRGLSPHLQSRFRQRVTSNFTQRLFDFAFNAEERAPTPR